MKRVTSLLAICFLTLAGMSPAAGGQARTCNDDWVTIDEDDPQILISTISFPLETTHRGALDREFDRVGG